MGSMPLDLEALRKIFEDKKTHMSVAQILKLETAADKSVLRCLVKIFPEHREVVVRYAWPSTGPSAGVFFYPVVGDLVLVAFADGDNESGYIISRLSSKTDTIPPNAIVGDLVMKALAGKKAWLSAQTLHLVKGDTAGSENLVLGQQLKTLLSDLIQLVMDLSEKVGTHTHSYIGAPVTPTPTSPPLEVVDFVAISSDLSALKASPVEDSAILSDFAFTEKGS